jgi:hypothetical protein
MSARKHGNRLNERKIECFFCQKLGYHKAVNLAMKNEVIFACRECQDSIELAESDCEDDLNSEKTC